MAARRCWTASPRPEALARLFAEHGFRLVDLVLSNLVNGGYLKIVGLTQYKSHSLDRHIATTWRMSPLLGNYVTPVPAQMRRGPLVRRSCRRGPLRVPSRSRLGASLEGH